MAIETVQVTLPLALREHNHFLFYCLYNYIIWSPCTVSLAICLISRTRSFALFKIWKAANNMNSVNN